MQKSIINQQLNARRHRRPVRVSHSTAIAEMDQGAGRICNVTSSFEWTIPGTVLQDINVTAKSPAHTFCGANWTVWMLRNRTGMCFFVRKEENEGTLNNHDGYVVKANLCLVVDGKEYPLHTDKPAFREDMQVSQYFISSGKSSEISWKHLEGDLKISCNLKCTVFTKELEEIPPQCFDLLAPLSFCSKTDASTETVQEDFIETAAAESDNAIIPADIDFQAALSFCCKTDASTETVQEDFIETATGESDESDDAIIPAGKWQTRISQLYDTKENADVRLVVKGRIFEAHRFVLAMRSPEFSRILISANAAVYTHIIEAEGVTEAAFDVLLRFLYTDTLGTTDKQSIIEAYVCALAYKVADLQDKCNEAMKAWNITNEEIFTLLDIGLDVPTLKDKCMHLLRTEGREALSSPTFLEISSRCLRFILESSVLEKVPLLERIKRVIEWCVHPHTDGADYAGARKKLLDDSSVPLLGRLEFENLELNELTLVLSIYQGLITPQELMCFLNYKHTQDASVLPAWCLSRVSSKGAS